MSIDAWNQRYRAGEQLFHKPSPLVERFAATVAAGRALDLACGPGRNALYLAAQGWRVTAVDGSPVAIDTLLHRARQQRLDIDARVKDLKREEFPIEPEAYDLICDCYYLQRDLFRPIKAGLRSGGILIAIVHLTGADPTPMRAVPGELRTHFADWTILHHYEGPPNESCHQHPVAEFVARKP